MGSNRAFMLVFFAAFLRLAQLQSAGTPSVTRTPSDSFTQATSFTFKITGTSANSLYDTYRCAIDTGGPTPQCASGTDSHSGLAEGVHTYTVQYYSTSLTHLGPKNTITWTIDTTPPSLQFTSADSGINGNKLQSDSVTEGFRVNSDENMGTYSCTLDILSGVNNRRSLSSCSIYNGQTSGAVTASNLAVNGQDIKYRINVTAVDLAKNSAKIMATFNIDRKLPDITMPRLGAPSLPDRYTQANVATFTFESQEAGVTFACRLNQGASSPCDGTISNPQEYGSPSSPQPEGDYDFTIIATDLANNRQNQFGVIDGQNVKIMTKYTWTVDRSPPNVPDINAYPANPSSNPNPTFTFSPPVPEIGGVTYLCEIKRPSSSFASFPCSETTIVATKSFPVSGAVNNELDSGPHTLRVQMKDGAGNIGKFNTFDWILDRYAPVTKMATNFASPPDKLTKSPDKTFNFFATDQYITRTDPNTNAFRVDLYSSCNSPHCTFQCHMDSENWSSCSSPQTVTDIVDAGKREVHTFYVRAVDEAGNAAAPVSFTWEIDRVDVTVTIISTPDRVDNDTSELFVWTTGENYLAEPPTFTCMIDSRANVPCGGSPDSSGFYNFTATGLTHGDHVFILVATDFVGNQGPQVKYSWTTDLIKPVVSHSRIWGPPAYTNNPTAKFTFTTEIKATLYCRLISGNVTVFPWERCSVRRSLAPGESDTYVYANLIDRQYTFYARAIDEGGNISPEVFYVFTIDTVGPATVYASKPDPYTNQLTATFVANSSAVLSTYECQYISDRYTDIQSLWLSCSVRPFYATTVDSWGAITFTVEQFKTIAGQTIRYIDKPHVMKVRAKDRAGNTGKETSWTWEIDLVPPVLNFNNTENDIVNKIPRPNVLRWINSPTFTLTSFAKDSTYTCQLELYNYRKRAFYKTSTTDCSPSYVFSNVTGGLYRILVRAADFFGNTNNVSTNLPGYVLGLVGNGPVAEIVTTPPQIANSLISNFTLSIPFPGAGANCSVRRRDATSSKETWWICVSPLLSQTTYQITGDKLVTFDTSTYVGPRDGKFDGEYIFKYHVFDQWGNRSPDVRYFWSIDIEDPRTALQYSTPEYTNNIDDVKFFYFSDENPIESFQCRLDRVSLYDHVPPSYSCPSIIGSTSHCNFEKCFGAGFQGNMSYSFLEDGTYEFSVKAVDLAGNEDQSPAIVRFTLDTQTDPIKIVEVFPSINVSMNDNVTIAFAGELGSQFFCRIKKRYDVKNTEPDFFSCESPYTFVPGPKEEREPGPFVAEIRVLDRAGNQRIVDVTVNLRNSDTFVEKQDKFRQSTDLNPPEDCPNYDTIIAAVAIAGFAIFAILAVVCPLVILSRMDSGSPSSFDTRKSAKSGEIEGAFSKRPLDEDYD
ncbi:uncharacterized protein [Oscarella lobularis]|uniref:uncharacterized protein n=1 Tax=Oscarella lobularis TaxID=121494 RepID=UPI0033137AA0